MKNFIFLAAIMIAAQSFISCGPFFGKGGELTIEATVSNGAEYNDFVDEVRAMGYYSDSSYYWEDIIIATGSWRNGGFKITLPTNIDARLLEPVFKVGDLPDDITINNPTVKGVTVGQIQGFKNNSNVCYFYHLYRDPDDEPGVYFRSVDVYYKFVDGDCKAFGSHVIVGSEGTCTLSVDLNLKKGWNAVYTTSTLVDSVFTIKQTTKKPDFDLIWIGGTMITP